MAALNFAADYVAEARKQLQDLVPPYRYETSDLVMALNLAISEIARLRPDFLMDATYTQRKYPSWAISRQSIPIYEAPEPVPPDWEDTPVAIPVQYQSALLYYITGYAQLRDNEENNDQRATVLLNKFVAQLLALPS